MMEYAPAGPLGTVIKTAAAQSKPFASSRVRRWARQIADGLQYVHQCRVLHRDLKPDNVLLGEDDDAKLADFGWSIKLAPSTMAQTFAGTPCAPPPPRGRATRMTHARAPAWGRGGGREGRGPGLTHRPRCGPVQTTWRPKC